MSQKFSESYIITTNIQATILTFALKDHTVNKGGYDFMKDGYILMRGDLVQL